MANKAITASVNISIQTPDGTEDTSANAIIDACYQVNGQTSDFLPGDKVIISVSKPANITLDTITVPDMSISAQGTVEKQKTEVLTFTDPLNAQQSVSDTIIGSPSIDVLGGSTGFNVVYDSEFSLFKAKASTFPALGVAIVEYKTLYYQYQLTIPAVLDDKIKKNGVTVIFWAIVEDIDDPC